MPVAHTRYTFRGSLLDGTEQWSTGLSTAPFPGAASQIQMQTVAGYARDLWLQHVWSGILLTHIPNRTRFVGVTASAYDSLGALRATGQADVVVPVPGGSNNSGLPPQVSEVISLRTSTAGARGRGRMYFPNLNVSAVNTTGRIQSLIQSDLATQFENFINGWNANADLFDVHVASPTGGFTTRVNQIRVGDVFDTQRRRRDALPEVYLLKPIP